MALTLAGVANNLVLPRFAVITILSIGCSISESAFDEVSIWAELAKALLPQDSNNIIRTVEATCGAKPNFAMRPANEHET